MWVAYANEITVCVSRRDILKDFRLDRFGLLSTSPGGNLVKICFDDLKYSAVSERR
jgi:hypothetical protein